jgi:imidazole glycerol-phosphate synthase subunit HisF
VTRQVLRRLIPVILIQGGYARVTQKFGNPTYIGDPVNVAKIFSDKMVDEIMVVDLDASQKTNELNLELLKRISEHAFVPTSYAGGVSSAQQAESVLRLGYEKVCLNSAFVDSPGAVREIGDSIGRSSVMVEVTVSSIDGELRAIDYRNKKLITGSVDDQIKKAEDSGAGEILIKSVSSDGQLAVECLEHLFSLPSQSGLPMLYAGGVSDDAIVRQLWAHGFDGVAAGTWLSVRGRLRAPMIHYPRPEALDAYRLNP